MLPIGLLEDIHLSLLDDVVRVGRVSFVDDLISFLELLKTHDSSNLVLLFLSELVKELNLIQVLSVLLELLNSKLLDYFLEGYPIDTPEFTLVDRPDRGRSGGIVQQS